MASGEHPWVKSIRVLSTLHAEGVRNEVIFIPLTQKCKTLMKSILATGYRKCCLWENHGARKIPVPVLVPTLSADCCVLQGTAMIDIYSVRQTDAGTYTCVADTGRDRATASLQLSGQCSPHQRAVFCTNLLFLPEDWSKCLQCALQMSRNVPQLLLKRNLS